MAGAAVEPFTCLDDSDAADALIRWVVMPAGDASAVLLLGQHAVRVGETAAASSLGVIDFDAEKNEVYGFSDAVPCAAAQRGSRAAFFAMPLVSKAVRQWWVGARIWRELCIQWFSPHRVPEVLSVQHDKEAFLQHVSRAFMRQLQELEQELWYYQGGSGEIHGPEPLARMRALLELQHITDDTMVRRGDQGIFRKLRAYARVVYRPIIDLQEIEQPHQLIVGLQFGGTSRRSVGAPSADKTRMDTLSCNLVLGSKNFFLGEPTELIVAVDSQESSRAAEVERDRDSRLCRARTGCFYPTPQFAADRAHWIALARSLVLCWENHKPLPFGGMNCPYRPERARQDFTLTLDLHTPRQELLQDFVFQCIADPDVMRRKAAGFDEVEHQRALAAHKFLSEPGAIPTITFSAVPKKKSHRRTPAAPRRARETLSLDLDDAELADAELAADLAINAEDELEGRLLEQVSSTAAFAPLTGFDFSTDVISEDAAAKLLAHLDTAPWVSDRDGRRVQVGHESLSLFVNTLYVCAPSRTTRHERADLAASGGIIRSCRCMVLGTSWTRPSHRCGCLRGCGGVWGLRWMMALPNC